jgi:hypothetical protein
MKSIIHHKQVLILPSGGAASLRVQSIVTTLVEYNDLLKPSSSDDNTVECIVNVGPFKSSNGMWCFSFAITKAVSIGKTACVTEALNPAAPSAKTSRHLRGVEPIARSYW